MATPDTAISNSARGLSFRHAKPICAALIIVTCLAITVSHYDQFAYLPDDGAYAYVASRMLAGDTLHKDVQDVHAGYINFMNAGAFVLFGESLRSLRVPLIALTVLQALMIFSLLAKFGAAPAFAGALGASSLTFVQFLNPTANWYCLFVTIALVWSAERLPRGSRRKLLTLGALAGTVFLFRQLTGVIVAIATLYHVFDSESDPDDETANWFSRSLLIAGLAAVLLYLATRTSVVSFFLFAAAPFVVATTVIGRCSVAPARALRCLAYLGTGAVASAIPLIAYHVFHGSLKIWFDDVFLSAFQLSASEFIQRVDFQWLLLAAIQQTVTSISLTAWLNSLFWIGILMLPTAVAIAVLHRRRTAKPAAPLHPLVLFAAFYSVVSIHYQIPIYLFYTASLTLAALLALAKDRGVAKWLTVSAAVLLSAVGLIYHAGESVSRGFAGLIAGTPGPQHSPCPLPRTDLSLTAEDCRLYESLLAQIERHAAPSDTVLALPVNPELYFLSGRRAPVRFFSSALALHSDADVKATLAVLTQTPPAIVFYNESDKYSTEQTRQLIRELRPHYRSATTIGPFEVLVL